MEENQKLNIGVGTEDGQQKLEAKNVRIVSLKVEEKQWNGKPSDQLVVMVKHPDKPEAFQIYNISYQKANSIKTVGFTVYYDSTGKLLKGTAPAEMLRLLNCSKLSELIGKEVPTVVSSKGWLAIKAY